MPNDVPAAVPTPAAAPAAPAATPAAAPVAAAPAPEVVAAPSPAATPAPTPEATPAPAAAEPAAPAEPATPTSLLGEAKPAEAKPAEAEPTPVQEAPPVEAAPEPIVYQPFQFPEGVPPIAEEEIKPFTEILGKHRAPQELGQELLTMHVNAVQDIAKAQAEGWRSTREGWRSEVMADPEIGGQRLQAILPEVASVIDQYGGQELREALNLTGAGDHPAVVRAFAKLARALGEGKITPAPRPMPLPVNKATRRYGNYTNGAA